MRPRPLPAHRRDWPLFKGSLLVAQRTRTEKEDPMRSSAHFRKVLTKMVPDKESRAEK